jgi:hypothetical protein
MQEGRCAGRKVCKKEGVQEKRKVFRKDGVQKGRYAEKMVCRKKGVQEGMCAGRRCAGRTVGWFFIYRNLEPQCPLSDVKIFTYSTALPQNISNKSSHFLCLGKN